MTEEEKGLAKSEVVFDQAKKITQEEKKVNFAREDAFVKEAKGFENSLFVGGDTKYTIINPLLNYLGKSYSSWVTDWFNWFLCREADTRRLGPVVHLRSHGLPSKRTEAYLAEFSKLDGSGSTNSDEIYQATYQNDPNILIGSERLQIFEDQAVFVPIIVAYSIKLPSQGFKDWGYMQEFTGLTIDGGDDPPGTQQLTINREPVNLGGFPMRMFRIATPIFTAVVPDAPYGTSLKNFLEDSPIEPGIYPAFVEGYFVMLKFLEGSYWVHSWASGPREVARPYFSELLYLIEVRQRNAGIKARIAESKKRKINEVRPARNLNKFLQKDDNTEFVGKEKEQFRKFFKK